MLPVEVVPFCHPATARAIVKGFAGLGLAITTRPRLSKSSEPLVTDNGNPIYDCISPGLPKPEKAADMFA